MSSLISLPENRRQPPLDPGFVSPALWEHAYLRLASSNVHSATAIIDILRPDGSGRRLEILSLPENAEFAPVNFFRVERLIKFLLWQTGGCRILIDGPQTWVRALAKMYAVGGVRAFDNDMIGHQVYGQSLHFESAVLANSPAPSLSSQPLGGHIAGHRIGFDLGGSDRKCAAVIDGQVVFSTEIPWAPYFEADPTYHMDGIRESIELAAAHLPQVDAIGGSAAGIYIDNEPRLGSLFRGLSQAAMEQQIRPFFRTLSKAWNSVPWQVANDGDVTALAGSMMAGEGEYLGIAMGTSMACGYVDHDKRITSMLNELAFVPVDFQDRAPADEWSGDSGCGVQYFSQQAVVRLAHCAGIPVSPDQPAAETLEEVQELAAEGDPRARRIFLTIGVYLAHALALFAQHYQLKQVLLLGRVMSGCGGEWIMEQTRETLAQEFSGLAEQIQLSVPDEQLRRHGQAIAAASLAAC